MLIASRWEELSRRDFLYFGALFPIADTPEFHTKTFSHFMQKAKWGKDKAFWRAQTPETIYDILCMGGSGHLFAYLFDKPNMPNALWKSFWHKGRRWVGPSDELLSLSFGEFRYAEDCLQVFLKNKSMDALNTFLGVLWRPGLRRKPFVFQKADGYAAKLKNVDYSFKCALLLQYIAMRGYLMAQNEDAFDKPTEGDTGGKTATWGNLISALASNIAEVQTIENMPVWTALEWLANRKKMRPNEQNN